MATGAQVTERIAAATGELPSTAFHAARTMREANPNLWPLARRGGGKGAAYVERHHLVNLALALAVAKPITTAPRMVLGYRNLVPFGGLPYQPEHMGVVSHLLFGPPVTDGRVFGNKGGLGADLETLIRVIASDLTQSDREWLVHSKIEVRLIVGSDTPEATLSYSDGTEWDETRRLEIPYRPQYSKTPHQSDPNWNFAPLPAEAPIVRHSIIDARLFNILADLWTDTERFRAVTSVTAPTKSRVLRKKTTTPASTSTIFPDVDKSTPESKTAALDPLPGIDAAALDGQPARTELDRHGQPYPRCEREKSQPHRRVGRSFPSTQE